jgi:integrase
LEGGGMMRERGRGSVTTTKGGRFRARLRLGGRAIVDEVFDTEAEAIEILAAARFELDRTQTAIATAPTLESWSREWWTRRETDGVHRSVKTERYVWATWIESAPFYSIPLGDIDRHAIRGWVRTLERAKSKRTGERISRQTAVHALNLVRRCLEDACDEPGLLGSNPARDVRIAKRPRETEGWTYLASKEIDILIACEAIPRSLRWLYVVAIYTGLRQGELWALRWEDVALDPSRPELHVRRSHGGPTKPGRPSSIPLMRPAFDALVAWKAETKWKRDHDYVFAREDGSRRPKKDDAGWSPRNKPTPRVIDGVRTKVNVHTEGMRERAGIARRVRFHDLRHTCGSHLVMGTWGRAWSILEVCHYLRHSSIKVTERYAHLAPEHLHATARATTGGTGGGSLSRLPSSPEAVQCVPTMISARGHEVQDSTPQLREFTGARPEGIEPPTSGLEARFDPESLRGFLVAVSPFVSPQDAIHAAQALLVEVATAPAVSVDRVRAFLAAVEQLAPHVAIASRLLATPLEGVAIERAVQLAADLLTAIAPRIEKHLHTIPARKAK